MGNRSDAAECTVTHQQAVQHGLQFESYASAHPEQFAADKIDPIVGKVSNDRGLACAELKQTSVTQFLA